MKTVKYAGIFKKIGDIPALRIELEEIFNSKSHREMVAYCLLLGQHILEITGMKPCDEMAESFEINKKWLHGETGKGFAKFQPARNVAGKLLGLAREEKDPVRQKTYRVMAQIANSPHVKHHALWASDYAIKLINTMYPDNIDEVRRERTIQIALMKSVCEEAI
ncbi:MAG: hypothetical protein LBH72_06595 [Proteiniphilum sp.]|nr:hypothetical protein [Proteiniphilum sp.]